MDRRGILTSLGACTLAGALTASSEREEASVTSQEKWHPRKQLIETPAGSCIRSGHLLFIGGIEGWQTGQGTGPSDVRTQVRNVLHTMKGILEGAGWSMANVLKVQMTVADPNRNLQVLNEVYLEFFPDPPPVRSFSGSKPSQMGREGVLCQLSCMAYVD
ncbi:MAG: RidA family protein [Chitinophagia bacterium]|nr:RidA family protein [Chitinophagia bacterium]